MSSISLSQSSRLICVVRVRMLTKLSSPPLIVSSSRPPIMMVCSSTFTSSSASSKGWMFGVRNLPAAGAPEPAVRSSTAVTSLIRSVPATARTLFRSFALMCMRILSLPSGRSGKSRFLRVVPVLRRSMKTGSKFRVIIVATSAVVTLPTPIGMATAVFPYSPVPVKRLCRYRALLRRAAAMRSRPKFTFACPNVLACGACGTTAARDPPGCAPRAS